MDKEKLEAWRKQSRIDTRKRIAAKGQLTVKLSPETIEKIIIISDTLKVPVGIMLREWVESHVDEYL
jgi:hypothetical protein